jgi:8-oxo-dGTP pyrophosphatase MutT (NUDIX family)
VTATRRLLLKTPRFDVCVDRVSQRNGSLRNYYYIRKLSAVAVVLHSDGEMLFLRTRRHRCRGVALELPGGRIELGETQLRAARREIQEELDLKNVPLRQFGVVYALASITNERVFMFSGRLSSSARSRMTITRDEGIIAARWVPFADVYRVVRKHVRSAMDGYAALLFLDELGNGG